MATPRSSPARGIERRLDPVRFPYAHGGSGPAASTLNRASFSSLEKFRQDADYTSEVVFTAPGATRDIEATNRIAETARRLLRAGERIA